MRVSETCEQTLYRQEQDRVDSTLCKTSRAIIRLRLTLYPGTFLKKVLACQKSSCMSSTLTMSSLTSTVF